MNIEKLPKDILFTLALQFDLEDLLNFCSSSNRIHQLVCEKDDIWLAKLNEFPKFRDFAFDITCESCESCEICEICETNKSYKDIYITLHTLRKIKNDLKLEMSLSELYNLKELERINIEIGTLPKEIGQLTNLKRLDLIYVNIKELPKEIGQLVNLKRVSLPLNKIQFLPKEIGNLTNLEELYLSFNELQSLPVEFGNLVNLKALSLNNNKITIFHKEVEEIIEKLVNLEKFFFIDIV